MKRGWFMDNYRHALASRGIKTVNKHNRHRLISNSQSKPIYTFYHGTSVSNAKRILKDGIRAHIMYPFFITPDKEWAEEYAMTQRIGVYSSGTVERDEPSVILRIDISEDDLLQPGVSPDTIKKRQEVLKEVYDKKYKEEYLLYHTIPSKRISVEEYL